MSHDRPLRRGDDRDRRIASWLTAPEGASARHALDEAFAGLALIPQERRWPWTTALDGLGRPVSLSLPRWAWPVLVVLLILALAVAALAGASLLRPFVDRLTALPVVAASLTTVTCPEDVAVAGPDPVCHLASVPERHDRPGGPRIEVFVAQFATDDGTDSQPLLLLDTDDPTEQWDIADIAGFASLVHRPVLAIDPRGTGHSSPRLDCPEVTALPPALTSRPLSEAPSRDALADAVRACRDRLMGTGIDLGAYGLRQQAADLESVRLALGIDAWSVGSHDEGSRLAVELIRSYPGAIQRVLLMAPTLPGQDRLSIVASGFREALAQLTAACSADAFCAAQYARPDVAYGDALAAAAGRPSVTVADPAGGPDLDVTVDPGLVARAFRAAVGDYGSLGGTPSRLDAWSGGDFGSLADGAVDGGWCDGYLTACAASRPVFGTDYSAVCLDAPVDPAGVVGLAAAEPDAGIAALMAGDPWLVICPAWAAGDADPSTSAPIHTDIPVLALAGRFDPYHPPIAVAEGMRGMSNGMLVTIPTTMDVFAAACVEAWLAEPPQTVDPSCASSREPPRFVDAP